MEKIERNQTQHLPGTQDNQHLYSDAHMAFKHTFKPKGQTEAAGPSDSVKFDRGKQQVNRAVYADNYLEDYHEGVMQHQEHNARGGDDNVAVKQNLDKRKTRSVRKKRALDS